MQTAFRLVSLWPLWLLHSCGFALGWLAYLLSPTYRRRMHEHAKLAGYGASVVRAAVAQAGKMAAELPRLWLGKSVPIFWGDTDCVDQAYQSDKGVVFLTPHMGCFEVVAQGLAQRYSAQHGPLTVLYRPARQPGLTKVMEESRQRPGLETAPTSLAGVRKMIKALRSGRAVGMLPDQVPPEGLGVWSPFFGKEAYTMTLAARLVQQTGAVPLLCWGERLSFGRGFRLHFSPFVQTLNDDLNAAVAQINFETERVISQRPEQYLWGYGRYKTPRVEA